MPSDTAPGDRMAADPECVAAHAYAEETKCVISYERSFMRPDFGG